MKLWATLCPYKVYKPMTHLVSWDVLLWLDLEWFISSLSDKDCDITHIFKTSFKISFFTLYGKMPINSSDMTCAAMLGHLHGNEPYPAYSPSAMPHGYCLPLTLFPLTSRMWLLPTTANGTRSWKTERERRILFRILWGHISMVSKFITWIKGHVWIKWFKVIKNNYLSKGSQCA